jgi:hypothetical protein
MLTHHSGGVPLSQTTLSARQHPGRRIAAANPSDERFIRCNSAGSCRANAFPSWRAVAASTWSPSGLQATRASGAHPDMKTAAMIAKPTTEPFVATCAPLGEGRRRLFAFIEGTDNSPRSRPRSLTSRSLHTGLEPGAPSGAMRSACPKRSPSISLIGTSEGLDGGLSKTEHLVTIVGADE